MGHIYLTFHVHIPGAYVHMCARYEASVIKPVARRSANNDDTRRTIHDLAFMLNEPTNEKAKRTRTCLNWCSRFHLARTCFPHTVHKTFFSLICTPTCSVMNDRHRIVQSMWHLFCIRVCSLKNTPELRDKMYTISIPRLLFYLLISQHQYILLCTTHRSTCVFHLHP